MNKIIVVLAALVAAAFLTPAAQAFDCDADDAAEVADCVRSVLKVPGLPRVLPPVVRPPAVLRDGCDLEDADDVAECMRKMRVPGVGRLLPKAASPADEIVPTEVLPGKIELAPAAGPAKLGGPDGGILCQKYFPSLGRMVLVPCE
jgi:hypothetical protein